MKRIYMVQRGKIRRPQPDREILSGYVDLDYMGASEFETGVRSDSIRAMHAVSSELRFVRFPSIRRTDNAELFGYGRFVNYDLEEFAGHLDDIIAGRLQPRPLEDLRLLKAMQLDQFPPNVRSAEQRTDYLAGLTSFWWDLQNHVMLSFDPEFMATLPDILAQTWASFHLEVADQPCTFNPATAAIPVTSV